MRCCRCSSRRVRSLATRCERATTGWMVKRCQDLGCRSRQCKLGEGGLCWEEVRAHELHSSIPRARDEAILGDGVPADGESLAFVLMEIHHGKVVNPEVEEFDRPIAACDNHLVLIDL